MTWQSAQSASHCCGSRMAALARNRTAPLVPYGATPPAGLSASGPHARPFARRAVGHRSDWVSRIRRFRSEPPRAFHCGEILLAGGGYPIGSWSHHGIRDPDLATHRDRLVPGTSARPQVVSRAHRLAERSERELTSAWCRRRPSTTQALAENGRQIVMHIIWTPRLCRELSSGAFVRPDRRR